MRSNNLQLVVFDWDGTLIDSHDYIIESMMHAAEVAGLQQPTRQAVSSIIGLSLLPAIQSLFPYLSEKDCMSVRVIYSEIYANKQRVQPRLFDGVMESMAHLRAAELSLAIATGKRREGLLSGLEFCECRHFFGELRTADDCASKPSPEMLLSILEATETDRGETIMVGDSVLDIQMSVSAGVRAFGVSTGSSSVAALRNAGAEACFDSIRDLKEHLLSEINR